VQFIVSTEGKIITIGQLKSDYDLGGMGERGDDPLPPGHQDQCHHGGNQPYHHQCSRQGEGRRLEKTTS